MLVYTCMMMIAINSYNNKLTYSNMKKIFIVIIIFSISSSVFSQSIKFRSGFHFESFNIPTNDIVKINTLFTIPTIDILFTTKVSENMSFETGIKYIPYDNRLRIYLPEPSFISIHYNMEYIYSSIGIPLVLKSILPIYSKKYKVFITTGVVPTLTIDRNNSINIAQYGKNNQNHISTKITEIQRVSDRNFNLLLNSGIGFSYTFKHFDIGIVTEYYVGLYTVYECDLIYENLENSDINNYQVTSKGSFFCINFEIAYPLFKPKNN